MGLFSAAQIEQINKVAERSKELVQQPTKKAKSITSDIDMMSAQVVKYFADSKSILITSEEQLADYIDHAIEAGYCGIDTETTGLDRIKDTIVGSSLYYPGGVECYIPNKHKIPIFDDLRKNQLTYEQCQRQFQRLVDAKVKMIFANADFDIAMIYKDYKVDFIPACYYDCILAWRCIKEDELHNGLKELYNKYVLGGKGDPKKFNDFFDVALFPYCKPEVAKLYAANDAKITYELFRWQLPYITKGNPKCTKHHLEKIADVVWGIEFPMIRVCAMMHRTGSFIDSDVARSIDKRYDEKYNEELAKLQQMVQTLIDDRDIPSNSKRPFKTGKDFNPTSVTHARYLCYNLLEVPVPTSGKEKGKQATSKEVLAELNLPETNQLLKVRSLSTLIGTFVKKLPKTVTPDGRIHAQFRSVGAATGRMSSAEPNLQNIPSHATDIRHMFRATAARNEVYELSKQDGCLSYDFFIYDSVYDDAGNLVKVRELKEGQLVQIIDGTPTNVSVQKIEQLPDYTYKRVCFKCTSDRKCKIRVRTPEYALIGSDYSQQEPKLLAFVIRDSAMCKAFSEGRDIYATIAGLAFNQPYEKCLEFHPETHEYQPEGKRMRGEAKTIVLGICYGRSTVTIGEQLFGTRDDMSDEDKTKEAQKIYDSVLNAFPNLRTGMLDAQNSAKVNGYVETILGRRRHIPDMMLPEFEFKAMPGYVNPDIDPLDVSTLKDKNEIPDRIVRQLTEEYANFKYNGQIYKRNNELYEEEHIKVINNRKKIGDASRQCLNSVIQGSAAELTKMAILRLFDDERWHKLGARLLIPVHDELICECPIENWEEAGQVLSDVMSSAGSFLPFTISCDVETSTRWYGLEYPCPYDEPTSLENLTEENIKWIQYHLLECEYTLPVFKDENGEKPRGDAAKGVNGKESEELRLAVVDYLHKYHINSTQFLDHIKQKVKSGIVA